MFKRFESKGREWLEYHEAEVKAMCRQSFADAPSSLSNLDRFFCTAAAAQPPIVLPSFAQDSYDQACSEHLMEDEGGAASYDLDPQLGPSKEVPLGKNLPLPLPWAHINSDADFERQDPQTVPTKLEELQHLSLLIGGNMYQLREVIDYWLPDATPAELETGRLKWQPSLLLEQARMRTIHELNSIQISFIDNLQALNQSICDLREGAFGGRLNTKSVTCAKQMFEKLRDLRELVLRVHRPASDCARSLRATGRWFEEKCLPPFLQLREPYRADRFNPNDPSQVHLAALFRQHVQGLFSTVRFIGEKYEQLSTIFKTVDLVCKTMSEGLHKLMFDVHRGLTTAEFIASWAGRWERVSFGLLVQVVGLPALNTALQRDFPGMEVEFMFAR